MFTFDFRFAAPVAFGLLAACGGGGGGSGSGGGTTPTNPTIEPTVLPSFTATGGDSVVSLAAVSLDSQARSTSGLTGTLDPTSNSFAVGTLSGDIATDRTEVALSEGGQITIAPGTTDFAVLFEAVPATGNRTIGVVGAVTPEADLPSGTAEYTGAADVTVADGASTFELNGTGTIAADFADGTVTVTASDLNGTQTIGLTAPVDVTDVATIAFTGSSIDGATFSGGTPSVTSTTLTALGADANSSLDGAFFGTSGDEAGAVFAIDDAGDSGVIAFGTVIAD